MTFVKQTKKKTQRNDSDQSQEIRQDTCAKRGKNVPSAGKMGLRQFTIGFSFEPDWLINLIG